MPFPVDEQWILETEDKLGVAFPASFKVMMKRLNGGHIFAADDTWNLYPFLDRSELKRIKRTCNDIVHETQFSRTCYGFPEDAVAIAGNGSGDQLVFLPDPNNPKQLLRTVFFHNHENGDVTEVADDFADIKRYDTK